MQLDHRQAVIVPKFGLHDVPIIGQHRHRFITAEERDRGRQIGIDDECSHRIGIGQAEGVLQSKGKLARRDRDGIHSSGAFVSAELQRQRDRFLNGGGVRSHGGGPDQLGRRDRLIELQVHRDAASLGRADFALSTVERLCRKAGVRGRVDVQMQARD